MGYDVFISYSRRDYIDANKQIIPGNIISQIKELFDANNISYWFDEDGVFSGDAFAPVIARNIKSSKIFLFISSENSNMSEWTSNEIATAHAFKKKIIPFRYDDSVYNDSVIIYIARLDYIEHKANPSKSLPRLLLSIQNYLKEEEEKKEAERQEEERRRNAEISRQERASKLQNLRERIEILTTRKYDIDKEILTQEKSLTDLRNERRILESNIADLQEEEASLSGSNRLKSSNHIKEDSKAPDTSRKKKNESHSPNFFSREIAELYEAMALKHWIVNSIYIGAFIIAFILTALVSIGIVAGHSAAIPVACTGIGALFGVYKMLKNYKSGIIWLAISFICVNIIAYILMNKAPISFILFSIIALAILFGALFIRKNGVSAWSLLLKRTKNEKATI